MGILKVKNQIEKELQQDFKKFLNQKEEKAKKELQQTTEPKRELACETC